MINFTNHRLELTSCQAREVVGSSPTQGANSKYVYCIAMNFFDREAEFIGEHQA